MKEAKVLLIYPGQLFFTVTDNRFAVNESLLSLFSYLKMNGVSNVTPLDFSLEWDAFPTKEEELSAFEAEVERRIGCFEFNIVAISCFTTYSYQSSLLMGRICRKVQPQATIVVGGWHCNSHPQDFIFPEPVFDFVVTGSGEKTLLNIVTGKVPKAYRKTKVIAGEHLTLAEYSQLEYLFEDFQIHSPTAYQARFATLDRIMLSMSRGCPYDCKFCGNSLLPTKKWHTLSAEKTFDLIGAAVKAFPSLRAVYFSESIFGLKKEWRRHFLSELPRRYPHLRFVIITRIDLLEEEDIRLMKSNQIFALFGVESLSVDILTIMNKTLNPVRYIHRSRECILLLRKYHIPHEIFIIMDHPGETVLTMNETYQNFHDVLDEGSNVMTFRYMHLPQFALRYKEYQRRFGTEFQGNLEWWKERRFFTYKALEDCYVPSKNPGESFCEAKLRFEEKIAALEDYYSSFCRTKTRTDVIDDFIKEWVP